VFENAYGALGCAKFGTKDKAGLATTPSFVVNGSAKLTFSAGAWNSNNEQTTLHLSVTGGTIEPAEIQLNKGSFGEYEAVITANGAVTLSFIGSETKNRFFLDDVLVKDPSTTGISEQKVARQSGAVYTLDGRYVGRDVQSLGRGMYIVDGKKIVK
jgi:hypothetical protein